MTEPASLPFFTRLWFAWACFFRVLFDSAFAARALAATQPAASPPALPSEPPPSVSERLKETMPETPKAKSNETHAPALALLALLQREGRLVDFLEQSITSFPDADVGAAARAVHDGCRKALRDHMKLAPIRSEDEGTKVTLDAGFDAQSVKLSGDVRGKGPYTGVLRHPGWRATEVKLPETLPGRDASVLFPAEVEL